MIAAPTSGTVIPDRVRLALAPHGHLEVVEHVVVGQALRLELPGLARAQRV